MIELLWGTWGFSSDVSLCSLMKEVHDGDLIHSLSSTILDVLGNSAIRSGWLCLSTLSYRDSLYHIVSLDIDMNYSTGASTLSYF